MDDAFKIYVDQLREGQEKQIDESFNADFLDINEDDLSFKDPVQLKGVAYLADDELILNLNVHTDAKMRCAICNESVNVPISIENFYTAEPISEIKTGIYDLREMLRETILLEVPAFTECNQGKCPKRKEFAKYLKEDSNLSKEQEEGYHPFADLDWKP